MNTGMKTKWEKLHSHSRFRPSYPSESVVKFVFKNFPRGNKSKILDLGCGCGRHLLFLAKENYCAYGIDHSMDGIKYSEQLLKKLGLKAELKVSDVDKLPFGENYFDGIVSYAVLYYCTAEKIQKAVDEIYRILKKGCTRIHFSQK